MEIKIVEGCINDRFDVDGKNISELDIEEVKEIFKNVSLKVCERAKGLEKYDLSATIRYIVHLFGEYESTDEPCDCCGDFIDTYTLEI